MYCSWRSPISSHEQAMHELSIAQSIVEIVHQYVPVGNCRSVKTVRVLVGEHAGVVPDSLSFCFEAITAETCSL
jgi:hydrogenase nickel incorporation protein HypA/HybF